MAGRVLAAMPTLEDPNFYQTLVFVAEHDADGALGFVVNRPLDKALGEVVQGADLADELGAIPVYAGGPVQRERMALALFMPGEKRGSWMCRLGLPLEQLEAHLRDKRACVRAFAGYAGWAAGQLDREIAHGSWKVCRPDATLFKTHLVAGLWPFFISGDVRWKSLLPHLPRETERN